MNDLTDEQVQAFYDQQKQEHLQIQTKIPGQPLEDFLDRINAIVFGVEPEDITMDFLWEIRKYMYAHPLFQKKPALTLAERIQWDADCKEYARAIVQVKRIESLLFLVRTNLAFLDSQT